MEEIPTTEESMKTKESVAKGYSTWTERSDVIIPKKLADLRQKLHHKAKQEPNFKFYALYDRISRMDTLETAWLKVKQNGGCAGVDGQRIEMVKVNGVTKLLEELQELLTTKTYKPQPVLRVNIPKANGKSRPLGIPCVRDRIVQAAVLLILEPIFEADFLECSYGFRPNRSAHDALRAIHTSLSKGFCEVYDADLASYFDTIPHDKLLKSVATRVSDRSVLKLIELWLKVPVVDKGETGGRPKWSRPKSGTPQGGVLSPLLANLYLHWFDKSINSPNSPISRAGVKLVRYADDFVITSRFMSPTIINYIRYLIEDRLGLQINQEKTRIVNLKDYGTSLDFLGYTFRFDWDLKGNRHKYLYWGVSTKSCQRAKDRIREFTSHKASYVPLPDLARRIHLFTRGWSGYFGLGYPRRGFNSINDFTMSRMYCHLRRRSQRGYKFPKDVKPWDYLGKYGLMRL